MFQYPWFLPSWKILLSAGFFVLGAPPFSIWGMPWITFLPWILEIQDILSDSPSQSSRIIKRLVIQGLWLGYFQSLGCFYWVQYAVQEFAGLGMGWSQFFLHSACLFLMEPHYSLLGLAVGLLHQFAPEQTRFAFKDSSSTSALLFFPLLYILLESLLPKIFHDTLGQALYLTPGIRQWAELGGTSLITCVLLVFQRGVIQTFQSRKLSGPFGCFLVLLAGGIFWGRVREETLGEQIAKAPRKLSVAAIQANIGDLQKLAAEQGGIEAALGAIDHHLYLSEQALSLVPRPEVIVWPETAYPSLYGANRHFLDIELQRRVVAFVQKYSVPLLFGGYDREPRSDRDQNAFWFLDPPHPLQVYHKSVLLPFGEYIPFFEGSSWVRTFFPQMGDFFRGPGAQVFSIGSLSLKIGPLICYEGILSDYSLDLARQGAEFLLLITNDSWFGKYTAPYQHLALATFRSIETRLPLLRDTNTGISTLILPDGRLTEQTPLNRSAILRVDIPLGGMHRLPFLDWKLFQGLQGLGFLGVLFSLFKRRKVS